jgi:hypothetical protein
MGEKSVIDSLSSRDPLQTFQGVPNAQSGIEFDPQNVSMRLQLPPLVSKRQCCGSGSGIRDWMLFNPWTWEGSGMGESQYPDPGSGMNNPDHIF